MGYTFPFKTNLFWIGHIAKEMAAGVADLGQNKIPAKYDFLHKYLPCHFRKLGWVKNATLTHSNDFTSQEHQEDRSQRGKERPPAQHWYISQIPRDPCCSVSNLNYCTMCIWSSFHVMWTISPQKPQTPLLAWKKLRNPQVIIFCQ